jgi:exosortase
VSLKIEDEPATRNLTVLGWALVGVVSVALILMMAIQPFDAGYADFRRTIVQTLLIYWRDPTWQHGALAPLIAVWLVWRQRSELVQLPLNGSYWGLSLLVVSAVLYYAGFKANSFYFGVASIQLFLAGAVLWVFGWQYAQKLFFAWLILCFSWPLIFLEDTIAFRLRLVMVECASWVLNVLGVDTLVEGTSLISAPDRESGSGPGDVFNLNVDGPCSGLRSLFALMMVSALFSYFRETSVQRRIALFATSIPLAVLANLVRLLILLAATSIFGQDFAVGSEEKEVSTFHFLSGIAVFVVALVGLQAIAGLMRIVWPVKVLKRAS